MKQKYEFKFDDDQKEFGPAIGITSEEFIDIKKKLRPFMEKMFRSENRADTFKVILEVMEGLDDSEKVLVAFLLWDFRDFMARTHETRGLQDILRGIVGKHEGQA